MVAKTEPGFELNLSARSFAKSWVLFAIGISYQLMLLIGSSPAAATTHWPVMPMQDEAATVSQLTAEIDKAETAFKENRFGDSAASINQAIQILEGLLSATQKSDVPEIRKQHRRIAAAQRMLRTKKEKTEAIPKLKFNYVEPTEEMVESNNEAMISFTENVAPLLAQKCGRCHISRRSGDVSLASLSQMVGLIEAKDSGGSQLYSVIEDNSMPKGNNKLTDEEKLMVKNWIDQGAKLDGGQLDFDLRPLMRMEAAQPSGPRQPVTMATEDDTVFFSKDIAPLLLESCNGCHISAMQVRGGLTMDNFNRMLAGGDSGPLLVPGKPDESLIVQKLKGMGDGQAMPINRPRWDEKKIELISTWIREGAHYDSLDPNTSIQSLVSLSTIASMDAQTLKKHRVDVADKQWKLALVDLTNEKQDTDAFHFVFGYGVKLETKKAIVEESQRIYDQIRKDLLGDGAPAFATAPLTVIVPKSGYDYSEFGKMVEQREVEVSEAFHWGQTVDGPYLLIKGSIQEDQIGEAMKAILPPAMVASWQPNLPNWFCNSVGHSVLESNASQLSAAAAYFSQNPVSDASIKQWVGDRLSTHQAYDLAAAIGWRKSKPQLKKLRTQLWEGVPFSTAIQDSLQGTAEQVAAALLRMGLQ